MARKIDIWFYLSLIMERCYNSCLYLIFKVLLVTGGLMKSGDPTDSTEIYQDNVWRTASALPFKYSNWGVSAITLKNRVLVLGND